MENYNYGSMYYFVPGAGGNAVPAGNASVPGQPSVHVSAPGPHQTLIQG